MKIEIVDCNNTVRRIYEKDTSGLALRNMYSTAAHNPNPVLFIYDGAGGKNQRRQFYKDYKEGRPPTSDAFRTTLALHKLLMQYTNKIVIEVPGWEADDVISHIVDLQKPEDPEIEIHSNDADFLAKLKEGRVSMTDPSEKFKDIEYSDVRLYKTLCGDGSDNIGGIYKFADKKFRGLTPEQRDLWRMMLAEGSDETMLLTMDLEADLGVKGVSANWVKDNFLQLKIFWKIVGFFDMDAELIAKHTIVGKPCPAAANAILKTVFQ